MENQIKMKPKSKSVQNRKKAKQKGMLQMMLEFDAEYRPLDEPWEAGATIGKRLTPLGVNRFTNMPGPQGSSYIRD